MGIFLGMLCISTRSAGWVLILDFCWLGISKIGNAGSTVSPLEGGAFHPKKRS